MVAQILGKVLFGAWRRFALTTMQTRFETVCYFISDAETPDDLGMPTVIWQSEDKAATDAKVEALSK